MFKVWVDFKIKRKKKKVYFFTLKVFMKVNKPEVAFSPMKLI